MRTGLFVVAALLVATHLVAGAPAYAQGLRSKEAKARIAALDADETPQEEETHWSA